MNANKFRDIFERFQNLNLIVLLEDLRRGLVCAEGWYTSPWRGEEAKMCPASHGFAACRRRVLDNVDQARQEEAIAAEQLGVSVDLVRNFVKWWDWGNSWPHLPNEGQVADLTSLLEDILAERMADADAVQRVTSPATLTWACGRPSHPGLLGLESLDCEK